MGMTPTGLIALGGRALTEVPVEPDGPEARQWLSDELAGPEYLSAQPTWFDLLAASIRDWFASLDFSGSGGPPGLGILIVVVAVAIALLIAFLVFGVPRINRKSSVTGTLFGDDDDRNSAAIRRAAEQAAGRDDFTTAIAEMFRAIARGLSERTILTVTPGTTAHDFGTRAGRAFVDDAGALADAATAFDEVRYLGRVGTRAQFEAISNLESKLRASKPDLQAVHA